MKSRLLSLLIIILLPLWVVAQTQQGYVKTKGRMVNGKHVPGQGLKGATVSIQDRTPVVVQSVDGSFSFPIPAQTFVLQSVQKNGYQLVDVDAIKYPIQYSANPIYLVMETPEQQTQDQLESERKIRRTLQRQLQQREDELEELKAAHKITIEDYQKAMQQLYADQENNEKLISDMAKQYAQMDYDQMDDLNQCISDAILNGRLTEADSLLRTKGSISERIANIRKIQQAEAQREEEIAQDQADLEASKAGTQKQIEDVAEDLHQYYDLCLLNHQFDSAAYYITLRADLDTSNYHYVLEAADYLTAQRQYQWAIKYFNTAIPIFLDGNRDSDTDEVYDSWLPYRNNLALAVIYENLGGLYFLSHRRVEGERAYKKALFYAQRLDGKEKVASIYTNLANLYKSTNRKKESKEAYLEALEIYRQMVEMDPEEYEPELAHTLTVLGGFYREEGSYEESEVALNEALSINRKLFQNDPDHYERALAHTLNDLGDLYRNTNRSSESEQAYLEALGILRKLANDNPQAYGTILAIALEDIGDLYIRNKHYSESEAVYQEALEINRSLAESNPEVYDSNLATTLYRLGLLYRKTKQFKESEAMFSESLKIRRQLVEDDLQMYEKRLAITLNGFALLYYDTRQYPESEALYLEALEIYRRLAEENPQVYEPDLASTLNSLGILYRQDQRFEESEAIHLEALEIRRRLAKDNPKAYEPDLTETLNNLAIVYNNLQRYSENEAMHLEAIEIRRRLVKEKPQVYSSDLASSLGNISFTYLFKQEFVKAEQFAREALEVDNTQTFVYTNLAAALLFQGKYDEAEQVYRQYKGELKDGFLGDLNDFEAACVIPEERKADVERIRKMLNE